MKCAFCSVAVLAQKLWYLISTSILSNLNPLPLVNEAIPLDQSFSVKRPYASDPHVLSKSSQWCLFYHITNVWIPHKYCLDLSKLETAEPGDFLLVTGNNGCLTAASQLYLDWTMHCSVNSILQESAQIPDHGKKQHVLLLPQSCLPHWQIP